MDAILFPWKFNPAGWKSDRDKITTKTVSSLMDLDTLITSNHRGILKLKEVHSYFMEYYSNEFARKPLTQQELIRDVIPTLQELIGDAEEIFKNGLHVLPRGVSTSIIVSRLQVATYLAMVFFGLFNYDYLGDSTDNFPELTFVHIYRKRDYMTISCLLNYFKRVATYLQEDNETFLHGNIIIRRSVVSSMIPWESSENPFPVVEFGDGHIDDSIAKNHVVPTREIIGEDLCKHTITSEEIQLFVRPELLISMFVCEEMDANEAIIVIGAEKISDYRGAGSSVTFLGDYEDSTPCSDGAGRIRQQGNIFINSINTLPGRNHFIEHFERDMMKAYAGFKPLPLSVAVGNWSYGFNGTNPRLKFIQIIMAASLAGVKKIVYFSFDSSFEEEIAGFIRWLIDSKITPSILYSYYARAIEDVGEHPKWNELDLFSMIQKKHTPTYRRRKDRLRGA